MSLKIIVFVATICAVYAEVELITEPKPGEEYVYLQTTGAGSRPIERKEKVSETERLFETAHKLPPSVTYALNQAEIDEEKPLKKNIKREASPADAPAPPPAGAIKLDPLKLIEMYKTELKTSTTVKPKTKSIGSRTTVSPVTTSSARTTRRASRLAPKRTKKEANHETTSPIPVLTTGSALKAIDDDIPYLASGSEKQRSRIQIKKGPNGQEYEYEYVYYYYDDDEDKKDTKGGKDKKEKITNGHDGPARNEITQKPSRGRTTAAPEPAVNEVLPTSRGRSRGRQLGEDDTVGEERLPANTRFPPRSRNLNTTPLPEDGEEEVKSRGRTRAKPDTSAESDSVSDETQGSRGRTRANVRRPSLELVDSASFNTHSSNEPPNGSGGPTFPADLPAGPVRFLGATPNERTELTNEDKKEEVVEEKEAPTVTASSDEVTTIMSPMDKVALDLYAILQGTQRLSGEGEDLNTEDSSETETTTLEITTEIPTTEAPTTTTTPAPTTTTTTTTTTPAPTTSSAPEPAFGRGRYRGRGGIGKKTTSTQSTTTEAPQETKPKGRFGRPSFGRPRPGARTTSAPEIQEEVAKEEKPASFARPTIGRSRFGAARTRPTTAAPSSENEEAPASSSASPTKPSLRPRPTFNLRSRTRTTAAPETDGAPGDEASEAPSTTTRSRPRVSNGNVRPLRPGPRINLASRGRLNAATPSTEAPAETAPVAEEETPKTEETEEKEVEASPAPDTNPLNRLRNRQRPNLQVKPKAAASAPVQVRRVNPLLARRRPEASTTETAPESPATETAPVETEEDGTEVQALSSSTSTTEEPRGLNKLLAGRRRLAVRQPGTLA